MWHRLRHGHVHLHQLRGDPGEREGALHWPGAGRWDMTNSSHSFASLELDRHQPDTDRVADNNASGTCLLDNVYWHLYWSFDMLQETQAVQSSSVENDNKIKNLEDKFTELQNPRNNPNAWIIQSSLHT